MDVDSQEHIPTPVEKDDEAMDTALDETATKQDPMVETDPWGQFGGLTEAARAAAAIPKTPAANRTPRHLEFNPGLL